MKRNVVTKLGFLTMLLGLYMAHGKEQVLCPRFVFTPQSIALSDPEKKLICGDPENPAWKEVPDSQAIYHLRAFLQQRGYYHPKIERKGDALHIDIGHKTIVDKVSFVGIPEGFEPERLRRMKGEVMTPGLLDQISARVEARLRSEGYPCPKVKMEGNYATREIRVTVMPGPFQHLTKVTEEKIEGLDEKILTRYYAFLLNERYNEDYLTLTNHRIIEQGIFQSAYFTTKCETDGAVASHQVVAGNKRLVRIGVGIDTERLAIARASWKNVRMGEMGSSVEVIATGSIRQQDLSVEGKWYVLPFPSRWFLRPGFQVKHENVTPYEKWTGKILAAPSVQWDTQDWGMKWFMGPTLNFVRTMRGEGPSYSNFLSLGTQFELSQHYFDFYSSSPRRGLNLVITGDFVKEGFYSDVDAQRVKLDFQYLYNLAHFDPPFLVVGFRGQVGAVVTDGTPQSAGRVPIDYRFFLGGSPDLRGFSYRELPEDGAGALSYITGSLEFRFPDLLPWNLQPFAFADAGVLSSRSLNLTSPLYWSPGIGIRWESPIGVIRTTLAHGFFDTSRGNPVHSHLQWYFSFGEEF